jgi:hypothetical protein
MDILRRDDIERLESAVRRQLSGRVRNFRLLVKDDGLILRGDAITYHAKQLAQHAILEAAPLPIRANEIAVCPFAAGPDAAVLECVGIFDDCDPA